MARMCAFLSVLMTALCCSGCENAKRSMVFFTGTTLGIEIAFEPNSTTPARFIVGYKRAEGLMDPVMEDKDGPNSGYTIKDEPHSVLAKIAGEVKSGSGAGNPSLHGAQWFASGRAAELLAANPLTAATLVNNVTASSTIAHAASSSETLKRVVATSPEKMALQNEFDELYAKSLKPNITEDGKTFADTDEYAEFAAGKVSGDPNKGWMLVRAEGGDELKKLIEKLKAVVQ